MSPPPIDDDPSLVELFDPAWADDPYPFYRHLRQHHPGCTGMSRCQLGVTRYDDIVALNRDGALSEDRITPFHQRLSPANGPRWTPLRRCCGT